jgi:phosphatidylglycerol---prolipoprotein diacylglyceryl transferase
MPWTHDLDPVILSLPGGFAVGWYGVSYIVGMVLGAWLIWRWAKRGRLPMRPGEIESFASAGCLGILLGGRLGFCLFYEPHLWWTLTDDPPWWGVLAINKGGMASHGGLAGMAIGCWWWCRRHNVRMSVMGDAVAAVAPIGVACGRIANFINGELWGRPTGTDWGVIFPEAPLVNGLAVARHPSQLYAAGLEGVIPAILALAVHARHRRPGLTIAVAIIAYAIGRIGGEVFREPDMGQPGGLGGSALIWGVFSKGQVLTLPLIVIGLGIAWWSWRRGPRPDDYRLPG